MSTTILVPLMCDEAVTMSGYTVTCRDKTPGAGGGLLIYIANNMNVTRLTQFESDFYEVLWISVRPKQLPRPLSLLIIAVAYYLPSYNVELKKNLADFILTSCDALTRQYPE